MNPGWNHGPPRILLKCFYGQCCIRLRYSVLTNGEPCFLLNHRDGSSSKKGCCVLSLDLYLITCFLKLPTSVPYLNYLRWFRILVWKIPTGRYFSLIFSLEKLSVWQSITKLLTFQMRWVNWLLKTIWPHLNVVLKNCDPSVGKIPTGRYFSLCVHTQGKEV